MSYNGWWKYSLPMWPMVPYYGIGCNKHCVNEYKEAHNISVCVFNTQVNGRAKLSSELVGNWYRWTFANWDYTSKTPGASCFKRFNSFLYFCCINLFLSFYLLWQEIVRSSVRSLSNIIILLQQCWTVLRQLWFGLHQLLTKQVCCFRLFHCIHQRVSNWVCWYESGDSNWYSSLA